MLGWVESEKSFIISGTVFFEKHNASLNRSYLWHV